MAYEDNLDGRDQSGNVVENTLTAAFAETLVPGGGFGTSVAENDDLRFSRGNAVAVMDHMGSALTLNGTNQYAYRATNDYHNVGEEDFTIFFIIKSSKVALRSIINRGWNGNGSYYIGLDSSGRLQIVIKDMSGNYVSEIMSTNPLSDGIAHYCCVVFDPSGYVYSFVDGEFYISKSLSSITGSIGGSFSFDIGYDSPNYFEGIIDEIRLFRFGKNGLYVTGTPGSNLKIEVGASGGDLIWDDTNDSNLIKLMYQSPYESLTNLGYGSLEDADPETAVYSSDFSVDEDGIIAVAGTVAGNIDGIGGEDDNLRYTSDAVTNGQHYISKTVFTVGRLYKVSFDYYIPSGQSNVDGLYFHANYWNVADGTHNTTDSWTTIMKVFKAPNTGMRIHLADGGSYNFQDAGGDDVAYFRNFSIEEAGEVCHYKFNNDLTDETSNGLDLTGVNTPTYTTNYLTSPKVYENINPHVGTIACWVRPNWDGDDGVEHKIFEKTYDGSNYIRITKNTSNQLRLIYEFSDSFVSADYSISSWNAGEWHSIVAVFSKNSIDGTDYLHLYVDGSEVANSTTKLGLVQGVEQYWDLGHDDGASQFNGLLSMQIEDIPWYATESAATTAGFNKCKSAEYFHNSGSGSVPVCDEHTKFMLVNDNEG